MRFAVVVICGLPGTPAVRVLQDCHATARRPTEAWSRADAIIFKGVMARVRMGACAYCRASCRGQLNNERKMLPYKYLMTGGRFLGFDVGDWSILVGGFALVALLVLLV